MRTDLSSLRPLMLVLVMQAVFVSPGGPFENREAGPLSEALNTFLSEVRQRSIPVVFSSNVLRDDLQDAGLLAGQPFLEHVRRKQDSAARLPSRRGIADELHSDA